MIKYMDSCNNIDQINQNEIKDTYLMREDAFSRASVTQHFGAGVCAGAVHGLCTITLESTSYLYHQRKYLQNVMTNNHSHNIIIKSQMKQTFRQSIPWAISCTLHHVVTHSVLFAS